LSTLCLCLQSTNLNYSIEWIRDNIKAFGGDPDKITIWGQSSGAESVDIYNYAWYKDPIVKGLIMDSGTSFIEDIFNSGVPGPRYSNFTYVASQFGCNNTSGPREEIACMKTVDAANIERIVADDVNAGSPANLAFGPAADEKTVFANWTERVLQGKITKLVSGILMAHRVKKLTVSTTSRLS
jgi:cholinesterase